MDCAVDGMTWFFMVCKREGEVGRTTGPLRLCGKGGSTEEIEGNCWM